MEASDDCALSRGWEGRIASKVAVAGVTGAATGSVLAILRQAPAVRYSLGTGASFALCVGCFAGVQESVQRVRCKDDSLNSLVAGSAAAYVLVGIHQGSSRKALAAALYCGTAAGLLHAANSYLGASDWLRPKSDAELAAAEAAEAVAARHRQQMPPEEHVPPWWERVLPLRRLSDQEWEDYQRNRRAAFQRRVETVREGGLPTQVEKQRRRLAERQAAAADATAQEQR